MLAPHHRQQPTSAQSLKTALASAFTAHCVSLYWSGDTFEFMCPQSLECEHLADKLTRRRTDNNRARRGQGLQTGSQIRGFAYDGFFLRRSLADQVANHYQSGGNADPGRQRLSVRSVKFGHRRGYS